MKVKIGPITANYKGTVKVEEADEENHRAVLQATGRDARGQGTASATIVSILQEEGDETRVKVETDMKLTGRAAQFGRGIAQEVATKMLTQFAECLEREISGGGAAEEAASTASTETSEDTGDGAVSQGAPPSTSVGGTAGTATPRREPEEQEAFDLGAASQEAILKRAVPVLAGLGLLAFLIWLIRR